MRTPLLTLAYSPYNNPDKNTNPNRESEDCEEVKYSRAAQNTKNAEQAFRAHVTRYCALHAGYTTHAAGDEGEWTEQVCP